MTWDLIRGHVISLAHISPAQHNCTIDLVQAATDTVQIHNNFIHILLSLCSGTINLLQSKVTLDQARLHLRQGTAHYRSKGCGLYSSLQTQILSITQPAYTSCSKKNCGWEVPAICSRISTDFFLWSIRTFVKGNIPLSCYHV